MPKKVFELAKDLGMGAIDLVEYLRGKDFVIRNHMQVLGDDEVEKIVNEFESNAQEEKKSVKKAAKKKKTVKKGGQEKSHQEECRQKKETAPGGKKREDNKAGRKKGP